MDKRIFIYGAGGHAKVIISMLRLLDWEIVGMVDDNVPAGTIVSGVKVLGSADLLSDLRAQGICNAVNSIGGIGNYTIRWNVFQRLRELDFYFPTFVHPAAFVEDSAVLADGVQILAQSYVSAGCSIGFGSLINSGVIISHDTEAGVCVNMSPGALVGGNVKVADYAQIGMGAAVNLGVRIGSAAIIGNSAVVKSDVPAGGRVHAGAIWPPSLEHGHADPGTNPHLHKFA